MKQARGAFTFATARRVSGFAASPDSVLRSHARKDRVVTGCVAVPAPDRPPGRRYVTTGAPPNQSLQMTTINRTAYP